MMTWEELPDHARVWVYQSDRLLTDEEIKVIQENAANFLKNWNSHGADLHAAIEVFNNLHVVVMVDENHTSASGCSIDKSVKFIQALGEHLQIDFFDRLNCAISRNDSIELVKAHEANKLDGIQSAFLFDNLVDSKGKLQNEWKKPVMETWLANFVQ